MFYRDLDNYINNPSSQSTYRIAATVLSDKIPNHGFPYPGELEASGLRGPVQTLAFADASQGFAADIVAMAHELWQRWESGDFVRRPIQAPAPPAAAPYPDSDSDADIGPAADAEPDVRDLAARQTDAYRALMRGVLVGPTPGGKQMRFKLERPARAANTYGHHGIAIGSVWFSQMTARRDGAHGASMAGIYGSTETGAYSIVSSGGAGYELADHDHGDVLYYAGARAPPRPDGAAPQITGTSRCLVANRTAGTAVRVIRGKGASRWAPRLGLRYDGLYKVESYDLVRQSGSSEEFWQFKLVRESGQGSLRKIVKEHPTMEEKAAIVAILRSGKMA